jgi:hypothetical protein
MSKERNQDRNQSPSRNPDQYDGLKFAVSEGRWSSVTRAFESQERALAGDNQLLDERLRAGSATHGEQKLAADLWTRRVKPVKKKHMQLLTEDRRQLVVEFVLKRESENPGVGREPFVQEAMDHFKINRSEVFTSLKEYGPK